MSCGLTTKPSPEPPVEYEVVFNGVTNALWKEPPPAPPLALESRRTRPTLTLMEQWVLDRMEDGREWTTTSLAVGARWSLWGLRHACERLAAQGLITRELHKGGNGVNGMARWYAYRIVR